MPRRRFAGAMLLYAEGPRGLRPAGFFFWEKIVVAVNVDDLEDAVLLVSDPDTPGEAWVCPDTGAVHVRSELVDEALAPLPDDIDTSDRYIPVPHMRQLALGLELVFDFADAALPDEADDVRKMFKRPGAYGKFSDLVEQRGLTDRWHAFREAQTRAVLGAWCEEHGLALAQQGLPH